MAMNVFHEAIDIEKEAQKQLNKWMVDKYANNRYLHKIPDKAKKDKYKEILEKVKKNNGE